MMNFRKTPQNVPLFHNPLNASRLGSIGLDRTHAYRVAAAGRVSTMFGRNQDNSSARSRRNARRGHPRIFATCESARPPYSTNCIRSRMSRAFPRIAAMPHRRQSCQGTFRLVPLLRLHRPPVLVGARLRERVEELLDGGARLAERAEHERDVFSKVRRRASTGPTVPGAVPQYVWSVR